MQGWVEIGMLWCVLVGVRSPHPLRKLTAYCGYLAAKPCTVGLCTTQAVWRWAQKQTETVVQSSDKMFGQDDPVPHPTPTFFIGFRQFPWPGRTGVGGHVPPRGYATASSSDVQLVCRSPWYLPPPPERAAASGQRHMLWSKVRGSTPNCFSGCWWCICSCGAQKKRSCTTVDWPISSCITTDWLTTAVVTQWATWLE